MPNSEGTIRQRALIYPLRCTLTVQEIRADVSARPPRLSVQIEPLAAYWAPAAARSQRPVEPAPALASESSVSDSLEARGGAAPHTAAAAGLENPVRCPLLPGLVGRAPKGPDGHVKALFRAEALHSRYQEDSGEALPEVSTSWWLLLGVLLSAVAVLVGVGWFGQVEVTSTATGSLRVQSGPRPVLSQTSGTVSELLVMAGDVVHEGQPVAKLASAQLEAEQKKLAQHLLLLEEGQRRARAVDGELHARTLQALKQKRRILAQRLEREVRRVVRLERRESEMRTLVREGVASGTEALDAQTALDAAHESVLLLRQQVADISIELLDREKAYGTDLLNRELGARESGAALEEAQSLAALAVLSAPLSGRVESLLVSAGQVVPSGAIVARIVPEGDVNRAVVFVPSKEAAFVREGLSANLEFPSLPVSDFGRARARVERVGHDVASAAEVADVLEGTLPGADALVRVELVIEDDAIWRQMAPRLRSGTRVTARLMTRERRILSLAFDFMKQWLPK